MKLKRAKVYRDPVHDIISYENQGDVGRLMVTLIDTPEFQRLRFVRQVGLAYLVFHGAEHSRFAHSMGVAYLARRMFDAVREGSATDCPDRVVTLVAALLHDIGHGPFSHAMERVFNFHHEDYSRALVSDDDSAICQTLRTFDPTLPERVAGLLEGRGNAFCADVVSSQMDADRFDYLLRDSLMAGVEVGGYDLERILLMLEEDENGLLVNVRAFESVEGYLVGRYHMYRLVYFHRCVRGAEAMLQMTFSRAKELMDQGVGVVAEGSLFGRLMRGDQLAPTEFCSLSEIDAWAQIKDWSRSADEVLAELASSLVNRRMFRAVEQDAGSPARLARLEAAEAEIVAELGEKSRYWFTVDVATDEPYSPYVPSSLSRGKAIRVRDRDGSVFRIEERSPLVGALGSASYSFRRWCYHPSLSGLVSKVAAAHGVIPGHGA
ncbi:MAG: HD domain-containing protein [Myxococcales bacterium]|nr:HD domain-containing protein [Myxococcales bacterium]